MIGLKRTACSAVALAAMGGATIIPALSASAATAQYRDTSVQAGTLTSHAITGTAGARDVNAAPAVSTQVKVSGLTGTGGGDVSYSFRHGGSAVYADGVKLTLSTDGAAPGNTVISAAGTPTAPGAAENGTVTLAVTDSAGDVAVVTVPVVVAANSVQLQNGAAANGGATTDKVALTGASDDNTTGSIVFTTTPASARVRESNLPHGLDSGNPLKPGSAVPGHYNGVTVTATDAAGAVATGSLSIRVNGRRISTPPTTPPSSKPGTGYVVNTYSGKCLDAVNAFGAAKTTTLQIWTCGAAGGEDQHFTYTGHTLRYDAANGDDRYCVSEPAYGERAILIAPCDDAASQYVTFDNGLYKYRDGRVLDDSGFGTANGNPVLVYAFNGGRNQLWSLPK